MRSLHSVSRELFVLFAILSSKKPAGCNPITNSNLNDHVTDFSSKESNINSTRIKTLQKQETGYLTATVGTPIRFKEIEASDNALSSSSYSRGLLQHERPGIHEYEDNPHIGYGYEYHIQDTDHGHHGFDHHPPGHYHGHYGGHHYHHKHYDHALAAKAILWPIAGIALLGAAAALVSNPVLLQLGVISGRRKRRDTEEVLEPEIDAELRWLNKDEKQIEKNTKLKRRFNKKEDTKQEYRMDSFYKVSNDSLKDRSPKQLYSNLKQAALFKKVHSTVQSPIEDVAIDIPRRYADSIEKYENKFEPVPVILKQTIPY